MKTKGIILSLSFGFLGGLIALIAFVLINSSSINIIADEDLPHSLVLDYYNSFHQIDDNKSSDFINTNLSNAGFFGLSNIGEIDFTVAAEKTLPAVVHLKTQFNAPNFTLYDFIFGTQPRHTTPVQSSGSGVILSSDGYIVTNNHVIENAEVIEVILNNRRTFPAVLVGRDATTDLALLKIEAENLPHIKYGDSDNIRVGEWVLAIGNPFNLTSTATHGIVSAKARNINILSDNLAIESFIQTDAAVNPGNSGGALVNKRGELIGINTAIASRTGSFVGYSFAIPVNIVRKVVADIVEFGEVQRAYLGVDIMNITTQLANELNLDNIEGVYVGRMWDKGAAKVAGVREGDVILEVDGFKVNSTSQLLEQLSKFRPGDSVDLKIKRNGSQRKYNVVLHNKYGNTDVIVTYKIEELGARFEPLVESDMKRLGISHGIQVSDTYRGVFASNGIRKGYIIMYVNKNPIKTIEDFKNEINRSNSLYIEGLYPNGRRAYYAFTRK